MEVKRKHTVKAKRGKPRTKYPFQDLKKIGDSIYVKGLDDGRRGVYSSLNSYNKTVSKPISITIKAEGDGIRIWKVSSSSKK